MIPSIGKSRDKKRINDDYQVVGERREWGVIFFFRGDEKVLKLDRGGEYTLLLKH